MVIHPCFWLSQTSMENTFFMDGEPASFEKDEGLRKMEEGGRGKY